MAARTRASAPGAEAVASIIAAGDDITEDVRMDGVFFFRSFARYPFDKALDPGSFSYCVMVRRGRMRLTIDFPERRVIDLEPGAIVGVSGLAPHRLHSLAEASAEPGGAFERVPLSGRIDPACEVELIVGVAPSESIALSNLIVGPVYLSLETAPECARRIWKAAELLDEEFADAGQEYGQAIIVRRIAEIILINMSRSVLMSREGEVGAVPRVMTSKGLLAAIRAFLDAPLDGWNMGRLARMAGMSRTKFAEEFRRVMHATPIHTLARIRLTLIAQRLVTEDLTVDEAADIAGYSSAAAFIRAFSREFGMTPLKWRKLHETSTGSGLPSANT